MIEHALALDVIPAPSQSCLFSNPNTSCYWSTGIVAGMGFPTCVADHGCVSSPPNMMIHMALD